MDYKDRGRDGLCLCCGGITAKQTTLTSKFFSMRAWGGGIEWSNTSQCPRCGFAFHGRGLSQEEIQSYYKSYRDENYFLGRNASEPFYTRRVHNELERQMGSEERRVALANYLNQKGVSVFQGPEDKSILDFAGGTG